MKKGQNVIIMTMKESGTMYLFGSISAIYSMFANEELGITYSALRNAVATHIKDHDIEKDECETAQLIYDNRRSKFTLHRAPLLLAEKK